MLPLWRPLPTRISRDDEEEKKAKTKPPRVNDDDDDDGNNQSSESSNAELLMNFGNREGHVAAVLEDEKNSKKTLICFGGWVESDGSEEVLGIDVSSSSSTSGSWKVVAKSPIAFRANASLCSIMSNSSSSSSSSAILFGGLDLDSYECTNEIFLVSYSSSSSSSDKEQQSLVKFTKIEFDDDQTPAPCPRQRHAACMIGQTQLVIYGGENEDNELLNDFWIFDLSTQKWSQLLNLPDDKQAVSCVAPRAAARLFSISHPHGTETETFIGLAGGLIFVEDGAQVSLNEIHLFKLSRQNQQLEHISCKMNFFASPVNCLLSVNLKPDQVMLFGGKDFSKGNDDLVIVSIVAEDEEKEEVDEKKVHLSFRKVSVIKCPFKESVKEDSNDEALSSLDRRSLLAPSETENCWPHWRYAAAVASWKVSSATGDEKNTFVACVGGTCRHVDPGCEVVVAKF